MCIRALDSCFSFFSFYISFLLQEMPDYILLITTVVPCCWRRWWHPTPVLLPGKTHGQRILVGCSPWGRKESDTTERLHFHFSLHALEKEIATHSSVLAWRIPGTVEPGGLPSLGSHRVGQDWRDLAAAAVPYCNVYNDVIGLNSSVIFNTLLSIYSFFDINWFILIGG